jgi:thiamine-phosphate pyrophosphorylase
MTDERQGDRLWTALERLPPGSGIVFRHYRLGGGERRSLFERVKGVARQRRLTLIVAGEWLPGADGVHNRRGPGIRTASAHDWAELRAAGRGADLVFLGPVHPTRSHPGEAALGPARFELLARRARAPVIALGGMDAARFQALRHAYGWAGIDAWSAA